MAFLHVIQLLRTSETITPHIRIWCVIIMVKKYVGTQIVFIINANWRTPQTEHQISKYVIIKRDSIKTMTNCLYNEFWRCDSRCRVAICNMYPLSIIYACGKPSTLIWWHYDTIFPFSLTANNSPTLVAQSSLLMLQDVGLLERQYITISAYEYISLPTSAAPLPLLHGK